LFNGFGLGGADTVGLGVTCGFGGTTTGGADGLLPNNEKMPLSFIPRLLRAKGCSVVSLLRTTVGAAGLSIVADSWGIYANVEVVIIIVFTRVIFIK
jgi:hypothetical protein